MSFLSALSSRQSYLLIIQFSLAVEMIKQYFMASTNSGEFSVQVKFKTGFNFQFLWIRELSRHPLYGRKKYNTPLKLRQRL